MILHAEFLFQWMECKKKIEKKELRRLTQSKVL